MRIRKFPWAVAAAPSVTFAFGLGLTWDPLSSVKLGVLAVFAGFAIWSLCKAFSKTATTSLSSGQKASFGFFTISLFVPLILGKSPISQQLYGVAGRNLGFFHYLFLLIILAGCTCIATLANIRLFLYALVSVGTTESILGILQKNSLDPLHFRNPIHEVFGTLGNSNYFSSLLALSTITLFFFFKTNSSLKSRALIVLAIFLHMYATWTSESSQGLLLIVIGLGLLLMLIAFNKSKLAGSISLLASSIFAFTSLLGILQKGPLANFLYQESVSFRGDYWRAGIQMWRHNWLAGVGLDSYGDFYRMYRDSTAATRRLTGSYPNSAHNLFIDLAATGGTLLLLAYIAILVLVSSSIFKNFKNGMHLNYQYSSLVIIWIAFNIQTLISINVSSLAIWGWISSGLLLGCQQEFAAEGLRPKVKGFKLSLSRHVLIFFVSTIPVIFVAPLIVKDTYLGHSSKAGVASEISKSVLKFPRDAEQIAAVAAAYNGIGFERDALALAKLAVAENKNSFRTWELIARNRFTTSADRNYALAKMKQLDPRFNPTID